MMKINTLAAGHSDPALLALKEEVGRASGSDPAQAAEPRAATSAGKSARLAEILSHYDVRDISPDDFTQMIRELYEAATITQAEFQLLNSIRLDLDGEEMEPDESVDLLDFYVEKIEDARGRLDDSDGAQAGQRQFSALLQRLDWVEKFALIQSTPDAFGLDSLA